MSECQTNVENELTFSWTDTIRSYLPAVLCFVGIPVAFGFGWYLFGILLPIFVLLLATLAHLCQCCCWCVRKLLKYPESAQQNNNNDHPIVSHSVGLPQQSLSQSAMHEEATFLLCDPPPSYKEATETVPSLDALPTYAQAMTMSANRFT